MKIKIPFCIVLVFGSIILMAQKYEPGDTIIINKGSLANGYKYVFIGNSTKKNNRIMRDLGDKSAVIISSRKITTTSIPSDLVLATVDSDTITIWMPYAQNNDEVYSNSVIINDEKSIRAYTGTIYNTGDTLQLGEGSMDDGSFKYIRNSSYSFTTAMLATNNVAYNRSANSLDRDYAGRRAKIKKIEVHGTRRTGWKKYAIIKLNPVVSQEVDIDAAIRTGEIIDPNYNPKTQQQQISVADELKKLNDLKKEGILSEEEYQQQKKKLLNN